MRGVTVPVPLTTGQLSSDHVTARGKSRAVLVRHARVCGAYAGKTAHQLPSCACTKSA